MLSAMAKKARTPKPPVKAPQRREAPRRQGAGLSAIPRWGWVVGGLVVAGIVAAVAIASLSGGSGGSSADVKAAMTAAGCTYRDVKPVPPRNKVNYHADSPTLSSKVRWSTSPPSAGGHYGAWAIWGFYRQPVNPRQVVHNEEHGAVVIWWGPKVPSATVDELEAFYQQQPDGMFGTPYPALGKKIALTAWTGDPSKYYRNGDYGTGHIAICPGFDQSAFAAFRDAYRGKGPEGIPLSADQPGMGPSS
jgi:uncharacterized protein DUF3105